MKNYQHLTAQEIALETSFIDLVKKSQNDDLPFMEDWLKANDEHKEKIYRAKKIVENLKFQPKYSLKNSEDKIWNKINNQIESTVDEQPNKVISLKSILPWMGIAASLLLVAFFVFKSDADLKIQTDFAETQYHALPDGSSIQLNAGSTLSYSEKTFSQDRVIALKGEAFFNVKKGSKFRVKTSNGTVEVLGTSFNVFSRSEVLEVICTSGKVAVHTASDKSILIANEKVTVKSKSATHIKERKNSLSRDQWIDGVYQYESSALSAIIDDMRRHWDINVSLDADVSDKLFTGSFSTSSLELALSEVCWPLELEFTIEEKEVRIFKK